MLHFIEKVGNLKLFFEEEYFLEEYYTTLYAINGSDIVKKETYCGKADTYLIRTLEERFLYHSFDICTLDVIQGGAQAIESEYDGALLSGKIAGFIDTEYFQKIDDTRFYQHYTQRPAMTVTELMDKWDRELADLRKKTASK